MTNFRGVGRHLGRGDGSLGKGDGGASPIFQKADYALQVYGCKYIGQANLEIMFMLYVYCRFLLQLGFLNLWPSWESKTETRQAKSISFHFCHSLRD